MMDSKSNFTRYFFKFKLKRHAFMYSVTGLIFLKCTKFAAVSSQAQKILFSKMCLILFL